MSGELNIVECLHTTRGGHWRYTRELAEAMAKAGAQVTIVTGAQAHTESTAVPVVAAFRSIDLAARGQRRVSNRLLGYAQQPAALRQVLQTRRVTGAGNWVHFQQLPTVKAHAMVAAARQAGYRTAVTIHNVTPHGRMLQDRVRQWSAKRAWSAADLLVVHSERFHDPVQELAGHARIAVIPHPVWPEPLRSDLEPDRDFLFFGVLRPNKGVDTLIDALVRLGNPPASIVGSGAPDQVQRIRAAIASRGLSQCELREGYLPDDQVPELFARHRVLVAPYRSFQAQSGITHLALAHHRPMVVTDVGALGDLVREFGVGELSSGSPPDLARAMSQVRAAWNSPEYADGFARALAERGADAIASQTLAALSH